MLSGSINGSFPANSYELNVTDEGSIRTYVHDRHTGMSFQMYAYRDRVIFSYMTDGGVIVEVARLHTSENRVILNHDAEGKYA
jgi:hypothetical protein